MLKTDAILADNRRGPTAVIKLILQRQGDVAVKVAHQEVLAVPSAQVRALEDRFATDSPNSDRFSIGRTPLKPKPLRQWSEKPSGGHPGHREETWEPVHSPDQFVTHTAVQGAASGTGLAGVAPTGYDRRQVVNLPPLMLSPRFRIE